ncbi:MAG: hypothetical protein EAZ37_09940 [Burkholderiales bacterium]|nr:MAG: hypothetical protein EAZ37_09940 [Burkholderiales bacterium]
MPFALIDYWRSLACARRMRHGFMVSRRSCATLVARDDEAASLNKSAMPHTPITSHWLARIGLIAARRSQNR